MLWWYRGVVILDINYGHWTLTEKSLQVYLLFLRIGSVHCAVDKSY